MTQRGIFAGAVAGLAMAFVANAATAASIMTHSGTPLTYHVMNVPGTPDGNSLMMTTSPGDYDVLFSSSDIIHNNGNTGGFAEVTSPGPASNKPGFSDLTIEALSPITGFSAIEFKLEIPGPLTTPGLIIPNDYQTDFTFDTRVFFSGGGYQDLLATLSADPHKFRVTAGAGEVISSIRLSNLVGTSTKNNEPTLIGSYNFEGIKQVSFDAAAVPEPSTWAMMIMGFGTAGALLRRRRVPTAAQV